MPTRLQCGLMATEGHVTCLRAASEVPLLKATWCGCPPQGAQVPTLEPVGGAGVWAVGWHLLRWGMGWRECQTRRVFGKHRQPW